MPAAQRVHYGVRVGLFFGALFIYYGAQLPYLPVWLSWRGLTSTEIGIITAAPLMARLIATPAVAFLADRSGQHRGILILLTWCGFAATLLLSQSHGFWLILALAMLTGLSMSTVMPLTETVAMAGVRRAGLDYGRMRLSGSLTFIAASFIGGAAVDRWGAGAGIWLIACGAALTVAAAHGLPRPDAAAEVRGQPRLTLSDVCGLMRSREMLAFLIAAGAVQSAHAVLYTFGTLHWRSEGISNATIGVLWAIGVAAEIVLFFYSGAVMKRLGAVTLLNIGGAAAVLRWLVMAFDPPLVVLLPLQLLHGATYGAAHLGAIHFIARAVPEGQAGTAQALYATITAGIGMGGAMLLSGQVYDAWGGRTYLLMAAMSAAALLAGLWLRRIWHGGLLVSRARGSSQSAEQSQRASRSK